MKRLITKRLAVSGPGLLALAALAAGCSPTSTAGHTTASPSGSRAHLTVTSTLTVRRTETLTGVDVTNGGVSGTGHCTLTGEAP
jgi:hypothetical protein